MLGPLDARVKARVKQKPRPRQRLADQVRPVDVQVRYPPGPIPGRQPLLMHGRQHAVLNHGLGLHPGLSCPNVLMLTMPMRTLARQDPAADEQQPETVENAKEIWDIMATHSPAPMLELVMNHSSFAQTIENIFALSFLVRLFASMYAPVIVSRVCLYTLLLLLLAGVSCRR